MNKQEIFDTVAKHLFSQGQRSVNANVVCLYRGPNGLKCAVGALIHDELYDPSMEGYNVEGIASKLPPDLLGKNNCNMLLLHDLQLVHDGSYGQWDSSASMRSHLKSVAENHRLSSYILETLSFKDR